MKITKSTGRLGPRQTVPDADARKDRLKSALKANIAKRKAQAAARGDRAAGTVSDDDPKQ